MNRKLVYTFSLVAFLLVWGVFGFAATPSRAEAAFQVASPPADTTAVVPAGTTEPFIPVTGEPEPVWVEILAFYGLIGLTALFLIFAMLNEANKSTVPYPQSKGSVSDETSRD